jgi:hypothetical protein
MQEIWFGTVPKWKTMCDKLEEGKTKMKQEEQEKANKTREEIAKLQVELNRIKEEANTAKIEREKLALTMSFEEEYLFYLNELDTIREIKSRQEKIEKEIKRLEASIDKSIKISEPPEFYTYYIGYADSKIQQDEQSNTKIDPNFKLYSKEYEDLEKDLDILSKQPYTPHGLEQKRWREEQGIWTPNDFPLSMDFRSKEEISLIRSPKRIFQAEAIKKLAIRFRNTKWFTEKSYKLLMKASDIIFADMEFKKNKEIMAMLKDALKSSSKAFRFQNALVRCMYHFTNIQNPPK